MSGRETILASIRKSLGVSGKEATRRETAAARVQGHPRGIVPARGQKKNEELLALFCAMVENAKASVTVLDSDSGVPAEVARYLRSKNLPHEVRRGADERLSLIPWAKEAALGVSVGTSDGKQLASVSHAFGGVAESGTLVLLSGNDNPTTLNFLPDHHLVVVDEKDIASDYETVWDNIRARFGERGMPRAVNWITGPSRSGDIEQTHLLGAHGPRSLHVLVVRSP
ncbi:MAG: lactate utilization protein [Xanthobacteraceae bacterium]|nr:lactate utilization protein [Xanthobacteraceae bacterium]QYK45467.1 MAG: lactate utilization protein [Xanthobacteraceae bacterium]